MTTQKDVLSQSDLEDHQNFACQTNNPPTPEEIALADDIIKKAWKLAEESETRSPEQIWAEFDTIRATLAASDSKQE